jgi:hypothetical protein
MHMQREQSDASRKKKQATHTFVQDVIVGVLVFLLAPPRSQPALVPDCPRVLVPTQPPHVVQDLHQQRAQLLHHLLPRVSRMFQVSGSELCAAIVLQNVAFSLTGAFCRHG